MTNIQCVNEVLRLVGLATVSSVETSGSSDAAEAWRCLESAERIIQEKGWSYNRRRDITITPDGSDHLLIPANVYPGSIDATGESGWMDLVMYGDRLYDREENTDEFDSAVKVSYILRFELCSIPDHVQWYIIHEAAVRMATWMEARSRKIPRMDLLMHGRNKARAHALRSDTAVTDQNLARDGNAVRLTGRPFDNMGDYPGYSRVVI